MQCEDVVKSIMSAYPSALHEGRNLLEGIDYVGNALNHGAFGAYDHYRHLMGMYEEFVSRYSRFAVPSRACGSWSA